MYIEEYPMADNKLTQDVLDKLNGQTYSEILTSMYAQAMDAAGINLYDPLITNMNFFNVYDKKGSLEPQTVGKTYIFMTRPDMNFESRLNIKRVPIFRDLSETKLGLILMKYLMHPNYGDIFGPTVVGGKDVDGTTYPEAFDVESEGLYNSYTPFIPLITNTCVEVSGSKDLMVEKYETDTDYSGNRLAYANGLDEVFSVGELVLSFDDPLYSPIFYLHLLRLLYMHNVTRGYCTARRIYRENRIIDYTSSIFVFVTGPDFSTIIRWAKYTGCFPINLPLNSIAHTNEPQIDLLKRISINYTYNRYEPMNTIVFSDFNRLVYPLLPKYINPSDSQCGRLSDKVAALKPKRLLDESLNDTYTNLLWGVVPFIVGNKLLFLSSNDFNAK